MSKFSSVQFSSVQDGIYALGIAHMRSTQSLKSFSNVAFETVPMFVWLTLALSRPFKEDRLALSKYIVMWKKKYRRKKNEKKPHLFLTFSKTMIKRLSLGVRRLKRNKLTHVMSVLFSVCVSGRSLLAKNGRSSANNHTTTANVALLAQLGSSFLLDGP